MILLPSKAVKSGLGCAFSCVNIHLMSMNWNPAEIKRQCRLDRVANCAQSVGRSPAGGVRKLRQYGYQLVNADLLVCRARGRAYFDPDATGYKPQMLLAKVKPGLKLTDDNFLLI